MIAGGLAENRTPKQGGKTMLTRRSVLGVCAAALAAAITTQASAQDTVKVGLILPMTGPFASTGRQIEAAVKLYMARNGDMAGGRKVELLVRDDTGLAP